MSYQKNKENKKWLIQCEFWCFSNTLYVKTGLVFVIANFHYGVVIKVKTDEKTSTQQRYQRGGEMQRFIEELKGDAG